MINTANLKFDKDGLIPAIVTDRATGEVLTLAYMNAESLQISIDEGRTCFWSRSRGKLWRKGESSGNVQHIVSIKTDCDMDALLISVDKEGPACHTGSESCFNGEVYGADLSRHCGLDPQSPGSIGDIVTTPADPFTLKTLHSIILDRQANPKPGSYTNYLFDKGIDKILKKFGEESTEVVIAGKGGVKSEVIYELADLVYHAYVLMTQFGIDPDDVLRELASRHTPKE